MRRERALAQTLRTFSSSAIRLCLVCRRPAVSMITSSTPRASAACSASNTTAPGSAPGRCATTGTSRRAPQLWSCSTAAARKVSAATSIAPAPPPSPARRAWPPSSSCRCRSRRPPARRGACPGERRCPATVSSASTSERSHAISPPGATLPRRARVVELPRHGFGRLDADVGGEQRLLQRLGCDHPPGGREPLAEERTSRSQPTAQSLQQIQRSPPAASPAERASYGISRLNAALALAIASPANAAGAAVSMHRTR